MEGNTVSEDIETSLLTTESSSKDLKVNRKSESLEKLSDLLPLESIQSPTKTQSKKFTFGQHVSS